MPCVSVMLIWLLTSLASAVKSAGGVSFVLSDAMPVTILASFAFVRGA